MPNIRDEVSVLQIPYIKEIEKVALKILRKDPNNKEKLKEMLENYANRYVREYDIRT